MKTEQMEFLSTEWFPGRLNPRQAGWSLGFTEREILILVAAGLLKPLGSPPSNKYVFFATAELQRLSKDEVWLADASDAVVEHRNGKQGRKAVPLPDSRPRVAG